MDDEAAFLSCGLEGVKFCGKNRKVKYHLRWYEICPFTRSTKGQMKYTKHLCVLCVKVTFFLSEKAN